jgi:hypothetical protein
MAPRHAQAPTAAARRQATQSRPLSWLIRCVESEAQLRPPTGGSPKRCIVEGARERVRRFPRSSVRDEPNGSVENIALAVRHIETAIERGLRAGPLLLEEAIRIHPSIVVEGQHGKRAAHHAHWSATASSTTRSAMRTRCPAKVGNTGLFGSRSIRSNFAFIRRYRCRFPFKLSLLGFHSVTDSSAGPLTHGRSAASTPSQRPSGGAGPSCVFGPFNWHNLAFDPLKLSPPAGQRADARKSLWSRRLTEKRWVCDAGTARAA